MRALAKLEQVLPDRLRRRVNAVHTNVSSMQWGVDTATVDADALAVLALACRDNEQVRFDYRRRDGDEAQRLVEPHNLVSAGRRWYLVGWDVRREDWRTFRLDRLDAPRLGGVRFRPRELPAEERGRVRRRVDRVDAGAVRGDDHRDRIRRGGAQPRSATRTPGSKRSTTPRCRVLIRSDSRPWLVTVVALLATEFDIVVEEPADLLADVKRLGLRLRAVATRAVKEQHTPTGRGPAHP